MKSDKTYDEDYFNEGVATASAPPEMEPEQVAELDGLAPDVVPALAPWTTVKVSQVLEWLEQGFDRDEIAVMIGHTRAHIDLMCKRYPALHNKRPKTSNRLPFAVVEDISE